MCTALPCAKECTKDSAIGNWYEPSLNTKRPLKRQLLHYQGNKPMDKQQPRTDSSGDFYPPAEDFKYTLLERSLGLTYSQILVMLIKNTSFVMHDLDAGYSSSSIGDGPTWISLTTDSELIDALVSVVPSASDSSCDIRREDSSPFWKAVSLITPCGEDPF